MCTTSQPCSSSRVLRRRLRRASLGRALLFGVLCSLGAHPAAAEPCQLALDLYRVEQIRDLDRRVGQKAAFEQRYSIDIFERRAQRWLEAERQLGTPDAAEMQAELDRIARETRRPERLRQIFAALDDDPRRIARVLVRPRLVEKRRRAAPGPPVAARRAVSSTPLRLPKILGTGTDEPDSWTVELPRGPQARRGQSALWTGSELLVWGGTAPGAGSGLASNAGFSYDPTTDAWTAMRLDESTPSPRAYHSAVWTGRTMIIWGGETWDEEAEPPYFAALQTGAIYDPVEDRWVATPLDGAPSPRLEAQAVWTGSEMVVWGGLVPLPPGGAPPPPAVPDYDALSDGARFDPAFGGWTAMGGVPPSARGRGAAVWSGDTLFLVGGFDGSTWLDPAIDTTTFAAYSPSTDFWNTSLPQPSSVPGGGGQPSLPFVAPRALWTGESLWLVQSASNALLSRFSGGTWSESAPPPATFRDLRYTAMGWTGRRLLLWGGVTGTAPAETIMERGLVYDTALDSWARIATDAAAPAARFGHFGAWTGAEFLVWGGATAPDPAGGFDRPASFSDTGGRFTPDWATPVDGGTWLPLPDPPVVPGIGHSLVWTGAEMIAWGGLSAATNLQEGAVYDPLLDTWSSTSLAGAPSARSEHTAVWTGSEMIVWGGIDSAGQLFDTGGRYDPVGDAWTATGGTPPEARSEHSAIWSGSQMIVWGGADEVGPLATGARYDPAGDTWTATGPTGAAARSGHTAEWTGSKMVIFGGLTGCPSSCQPSDEAAVYDPLLDTWSAPFAPPSGGHRFGHSSVWTGAEVIAWGGAGGYLDSNPCLDDGVHIDPASSSAVLIGAGGGARCGHTAVWNGAEMIVWGGVDRLNVATDGGVPPATPLATGGRLELSSDLWTPTLDDSSTIAAAAWHTAVWTGEEMLVWGGRPEVSGSLGVYYTDTVPTSSPQVLVDGSASAAVLLGGGAETVTLGQSLPAASYDDVEASPQWTAGAEGGSSWHIATAGSCTESGDFVSPFSAWRFGAAGTCHYQGAAGVFTLTSDSTFTFTSDTLLELRYLLDTDAVGNTAEQDQARIEYSTDGGSSWSVLAIDETHQAAAPSAAPLDDRGSRWRGLAIELGAVAGPTADGRLRFVFERQGSLNAGVGWLIDDISIGEPAGDGRLPAGSLTASDGSVSLHRVAAHDRWDRPSFAWDIDGDGLADNPDSRLPGFAFTEDDLADYGLDLPGVYELELTVSDLGGQSEAATVSLEVVDGEPPSVEVLSPNGGEAWTAGSVQSITWAASDNIALAGFDLAFYDDEAGTGPTPIACAETLDGDARRCTWTLPGSTSTAARVEVTARDERPAPDGPNTASDASDAPFYLVQANSDEIRSLILWHSGRVGARFGDGAKDALGAGLATFAAHVKVDGVVLDLANVPSLASLYDAWDGTAWTTGTAADLDDNVARANELAAAIRNYLFEQVSSSFTGLEFLVLVGGDSSIPFWRLDEDLPRYPESNYIAELQAFGFLDDASSAAAFCDETESPLMTTFCRDRYLADAPYGSSLLTTVPGSSFEWWLPDLAAGRLVETPEQMLGLIDVFIAQDGVTVVDRALASGYDFLTDAGDAVVSLLESELDGSVQIERLSQAVQSWSDIDLLDRLFGVGATEASDLSFVAGHADHRAEGAAALGDAGVLTTEEMAAAATWNRGGVLVGVGCHSGVNVEADGGAADETDAAFLLDLPEILADRDFPAMVGHGGYGWGLSEGVGLTEQLMLLIAEQITGAGQVAVGEALRLAKQEYFLRQNRLDAFDNKVLHEAMLFGLPNYQVRVPEAAKAAPRPPLGDASWSALELAPHRRLTKAPLRQLSREPSRGSADKGAATLRILDLSFQAYEEGQDTDQDPATADWQEAYAQFDWCTDSSGESLLCTGAAGEDTVGTYFTLDGVASYEAGQPIQPMFSFDSRLAGSELHGVLIRGGSLIQPPQINPQDAARCTDELGTIHACFDPVVGNPETEIDEEEGPAPTPFINIDTPTPFINIDTPTSSGFLAAGASGGRFDTLNAPMGALVRRGVREPSPGEREEIYSQWLYRTRDFTHYYSSSTDWQAPEIGPFTAECEAEIDGLDCFHTQVAGGGTTTASFDVPVSDTGDGLYRVFLTFIQDVDTAGRGAWQTVELAATGPGRFGGEIEAQRSTFYLLQAVDWAGNVGRVTVTGDDVDGSGDAMGSSFEAPRLFTIRVDDGALFSDGFETGAADRWSETAP